MQSFHPRISFDIIFFFRNNKNLASIENLFFFFVCAEYFSLSLFLFKSIFLHDSFISKIEKKKKLYILGFRLKLKKIVKRKIQPKFV